MNSLSHARAQRIESEVAYSDKFLRLRFRDDGIGIESEILKNRGRKGHWGMTGMYERAKNVHAFLSIWSKPGAGTEVELTRVWSINAADIAPGVGAPTSAAFRSGQRCSARSAMSIHDLLIDRASFEAPGANPAWAPPARGPPPNTRIHRQTEAFPPRKSLFLKHSCNSPLGIVVRCCASPRFPLQSATGIFRPVVG